MMHETRHHGAKHDRQIRPGQPCAYDIPEGRGDHREQKEREDILPGAQRLPGKYDKLVPRDAQQQKRDAAFHPHLLARG